MNRTNSPFIFLVTITLLLTYSLGFAQQAQVKIIPKDSQTLSNLDGIIVNVYDQNNELVDTGTSTNEGVTFGLATSVENVDAMAPFKFNPQSKSIEYELNSQSNVKIVLTGTLGKQKILYNNFENTGNHSHRLSIDNLANGNYTIQVLSNDFFAIYNFNKVDNNIYLNTKSHLVNLTKKFNNNKLLKLDPGKQYKFVAISNDHFKDSLEVVVENDMSLDVLMDKSKNVHFELYNNDTDSLDDGFVIIGKDTLGINGERDISIPYSDTLKFVAGIFSDIDSVYLRTKKVDPKDLKDTVKVTAIDMYLRDMNKDIVGMLGEEGRRVTPGIFKRFMNVSFFTSSYNGVGVPGGIFDDGINRWTKSNNNDMPDSIVVYKYSDRAGTLSIMDQVTIDRVVDLYNTHLKPFFDEEGLNVPLLIDSVNTYYYFNVENNSKIDYMVIVPRGDMTNDGELTIWGETPNTIRYNLIKLRSGPPSGDPGEPWGTRAALQELTGVEATRSPPPDYSILSSGETIIIDGTSLHDYSLYDIKAFRIWHEMDWKTGTKEEEIMKLIGLNDKLMELKR